MVLKTPSLSVLEYGWKLSNKRYTPVLSAGLIAPDYLLKFVRAVKGTVAHLGAVKTSKQATYNGRKEDVSE